MVGSQHMDKTQAEAIAQAILQPDLKAQEELRRKKEKAAWLLAEKRKVAWFILTGFAVGAAFAYVNDTPFTTGGLWGAISAGAFGWLLVGWRTLRRAA